MVGYFIGQVVFSKSGRDQGKPFVIVEQQGEYVYLVDGAVRKMTHPKKKKIKHVQITHDIIDEIKRIIQEGLLLKDADVRKFLKPYSKV